MHMGQARITKDVLYLSSLHRYAKKLCESIYRLN